MIPKWFMFSWLAIMLVGAAIYVYDRWKEHDRELAERERKRRGFEVKPTTGPLPVLTQKENDHG